MNVREFMDGTAAPTPPPVLLFCPGTGRGKNPTFEPVLAAEAVKKLVDAAIDPSLRDMGYSLFYADESDTAQIVMEARTLPFLTERRVVEVRNAEVYITESKVAPLLPYLDDPNPTTLLILIASSVDRRLKFFKACQRAGEIVDCPELNGGEVEQWIAKEIRNRQKSIEAGAVREIMRRAGNHLGDVANALEVVSTYVGGEPQIRVEDVIAACADVAEEEVWALTDAIAKSNMGRALTALRRLLDMGKAPDELMGTINWMLKSAYSVAAPGYGQKLNPWVADKMKPLADKLGIAKLRDAFTLCTDTHFLMRSTGVNAELAMEILVLKLAAPRRTPARAPGRRA